MGCGASKTATDAAASPKAQPKADGAPTQPPAVTAPVPAAPAGDTAASMTTLAMIKPDALSAGHADIIKAEIVSAGFTIQKERKYQMTVGQAAEFYAEHKGKDFFTPLTLFMASGEIVALELVKEGAIPAWRALCGPTNSIKAKEDAPKSLRARFGTDGRQNAVHGSDSAASAERETAFHFPPGWESLATIPAQAEKKGPDNMDVVERAPAPPAAQDAAPDAPPAEVVTQAAPEAIAEVEAAVDAEPAGETAEVDNLVEELATDVAETAAPPAEDEAEKSTEGAAAKE